ncbi:MAG: DUF1566 domain-containing protein [Desulfovibrio sp.]
MAKRNLIFQITLQIIAVIIVGGILVMTVMPALSAQRLTYPIVDTGQEIAFDNIKAVSSPKVGAKFYGQDAQYRGLQPLYKDNGDGTISDLNTGLMWVKARGQKKSWDDAIRGAKSSRVGGYTDWRAPTIKELYSLINFMGMGMRTESQSKPYLDTRYFEFAYGDESRGERIIDCQDWSATKYVHKTMKRNETVFGVNFADGRIKGYGITHPRKGANKLYMRYVRGNSSYGKNIFVDNKNGIISDKATGLMWQQLDSGKGLDWEEALAYANAFSLGGYSDWRLPNAKELQSIVDYSRSPKTTGSPAIDPLFKNTKRESHYWTGTTHLDGGHVEAAVYLAFGRAMGYMRSPRTGSTEYMDVHGAGAQRSDPKSGNPDRFKNGRGPQGDEVLIYNYVRCVRGGVAEPVESRDATSTEITLFTQRRGQGGPGVESQFQQGSAGGHPPRGFGKPRRQ